MKHDKIADIDEKLALLDTGLNSYFENYNLPQLEHVINKVDEMKDEHTVVYHKFDHYKSRDINELMELSNRLLLIKSLLDEFDQHTSFFEKLDKLENLQSKFHELENSLDDDVHISELNLFNELEQKIEDGKTSLIHESQKYLDKYILTTAEELVVFEEIENQTFAFTLSTIDSFCGESFNGYMKLTKKFQDWFESAFAQLDSGKAFKFDNDDNKKSLKIVDSDTNFSQFAISVKQLILFMNQLKKYTEDVKSLSNIRPIIGKQLLKEIRSRMFCKENVYPLIIDKLNYEEGSELSNISKLYEISSLLAESGWSKDGICELEFWIDDLTSFWVNNLVDYTIDDIKQFVCDFLAGEYEDRLKDHNLVVVELYTTNNAKKIHKETNDEWENNWEEKDDWNEDDNNSENKRASAIPVSQLDDSVDDGGWGDDQDLNLDLDGADENVEEEDGWDAWNEEIEISDNEVENPEETVKEKHKTPLVPSYKHTTLVGEICGLFAKYFSNFNDLSKFDVKKEQLSDIRELFKQGLKKLCMAYFMMIQSDILHTYKNRILFYNDISKLLEGCSISYEIDLDSCYKLNTNFLDELINEYTEKLILVISQYNTSIWGDNALTNNEINEESYKFMNEFDLHLEQVLQEFENSTTLNTQLIANLVVTMIFKTLNIMCNKLVSRNDISSYESSILSEIIEHIIKEVRSRLMKLNINTGNIQSMVKLQQIQLILSSNLKEILEAFYDAKFYELETFELTSLIKSLFVDSMQRDQIIREITTLREEA